MSTDLPGGPNRSPITIVNSTGGSLTITGPANGVYTLDDGTSAQPLNVSTAYMVDNNDGTYNFFRYAGDTPFVIDTNASAIDVVDAGNHYTGSNVEDILQEIGVQLAGSSHDEMELATGSNPALTIDTPNQEASLDLTAAGSFDNSSNGFTADDIQGAIEEASEGDPIDSTEITDADLATAGTPILSDVNSFVTANSITNQYVVYVGGGSLNEPDYVWFVEPDGNVVRLEKPVPSGGAFTFDVVDDNGNTATYDSADPSKDFLKFIGATVDPLTNEVSFGTPLFSNISGSSVDIASFDFEKTDGTVAQYAGGTVDVTTITGYVQGADNYLSVDDLGVLSFSPSYEDGKAKVGVITTDGADAITGTIADDVEVADSKSATGSVSGGALLRYQLGSSTKNTPSINKFISHELVASTGIYTNYYCDFDGMIFKKLNFPTPQAGYSTSSTFIMHSAIIEDGTNLWAYCTYKDGRTFRYDLNDPASNISGVQTSRIGKALGTANQPSGVGWGGVYMVYDTVNNTMVMAFDSNNSIFSSQWSYYTIDHATNTFVWVNDFNTTNNATDKALSGANLYQSDGFHPPTLKYDASTGSLVRNILLNAGNQFYELIQISGIWYLTVPGSPDSSRALTIFPLF